MVDPKEHHQQYKIAWQQHVRQMLRQLQESDDLFLNNRITITEDERTVLAKNDTTYAKCNTIDYAHITQDKPSIVLVQHGCNTAYSMCLAFNRMLKKLNKTTRHVSFAAHNSMRLFNNHMVPIMITYVSGADGNYLSKRDCFKAGLPILRQSTRKVGVANGGASQAKHVT